MSDSQEDRLLRRACAATLLIAVAICITTLTPAMPSVGPPGSDKLQHFAGFFCLALPLGYARPRWGWHIIAGVAGFGAMIELVQPYVGRGAEWGDLLADIAGASTAVLLMWFLRR